ncbi:MarR family transcriptional regulator [Alkalibaculum sp. M08DMB]|uniref:MarR family transcriptional regulator n=1 Tax=Alkalibaculum sporogenes TaxID=2655001 RepID=A0A6A7K6I3_9FIRM|nr:MarR family transcriptional regulator [Alkalibaculum sporogenes]MPW24951.1 MarR family transcriptional regulator [Alkalibaculum sporogenes]
MKEKKKSLIKAISAIYRYSQTYIGENIKKYNIGKGQWNFLTQLLFNEDGLTQEELSDTLHIDKANTARALKLLEDEDYIYRQLDPKDARKKRIYVTNKSRVFEEEFHCVFKDLNKILSKDFTPEEKEMARILLYRMLDNIIAYRETQGKGK